MSPIRDRGHADPKRFRQTSGSLPPWWTFAALIVVTFLIYQPVWYGSFLWDDEGHVTPAALRSAEGLRRIWFEPGATQQYYPLLHTAFWVQHRLWGEATIGYHHVSLGLHALSACLVVLISARLGVAGALLAGFLFAVHPAHVESVAWISEQKNTLSGVLFLASGLAYLRFDRSRRALDYAAAFVAFLLALLSKTVTATLPAALIVTLWWKRGGIVPRRDVGPLVPFFVTGLGAALVTIWVERTFIGAQGVDFDLSPMQRVLVASRAVWFYLVTLLWPVDLGFNYPRWHVDPSSLMWWFYPLCLALLLVAAWRFRTRSRAPVTALLLFIVLLSPALGFVDVYPFRYSFVADHFQYLASIPILVLTAAAAGTAVRTGRRAVLARTGAAVVVAALCTLTWRYSRTFADVETLYAATIASNPRSWFAHTNLGTLRLRTDPSSAVAHFRAALEERPDLREARISLGYGLQQLGKLHEAADEYREAIRRHPDASEAHNNLCSVLQQTGDVAGAIAACRRAIELRPGYANAHRNLGMAFERLGRNDEALTQYTHALDAQPSAELHDARGLLLQRLGRFAEAAEDHSRAVKLQPGGASSLNNLGGALLRLGRPYDATAAFARAVQLQPAFVDARFNLANALQMTGRFPEAIPHYRVVVEQTPQDASAWTNLGVALERSGRADDALAAYREALRIDPASRRARENLAALTRRR